MSDREYLDWQSDLSLERIFSDSEAVAYPFLQSGRLAYLSSIPDQDNRTTIVSRDLQRLDDLQVEVPSPFSLRTRICEYGGKPFWMFADDLVFCNDADQCLYRLELGSNNHPQRLSGDPDRPGHYRFADVVKVDEHRYVSVVEELADDGYKGHAHPHAFIAVIDVDAGGAQPMPLPVAADFFSNLVIDTKQKRIAWVQWNHPNMPWDETELWVASYKSNEAGFSLIKPRRVELPTGASVCQLCFAKGKLFFVADFPDTSAKDASNFWNIHSIEFADNAVTLSPVSQYQREFGYPHWQYGDHRLIAAGDEKLVAIGTTSEGDILSVIDLESMAITDLTNDAIYFQHLACTTSNQVVLLARYKNKGVAVIELDTQNLEGKILYQVEAGLAAEEVSDAEHIAYATGNGEQAFAYYYPPRNSLYLESATPPPLLVMVHGGPTARAYPFFDLQKQFWTQRGFAVVDVNHRGSNGYGRLFRDRLYGDWGGADAEDIRSCVQHLIEAGKANPTQVMIRGKSAGGYAVLRALTEFPDTFVAGACYYGIGNLVTLAATTHKFESAYTDRLIGESYDAERALREGSEFFRRSPINKIDQIRAAMIVFQGSEDKVVPPSVAHEIVAALKQQKLVHKYVEYAGEAHGFREPANNIDAWQHELDFYREVLDKQ